MAESTRYEITVVSKATYVEDQSDPSKNQYVFAYTITISNTGNVPAQLVSRHWVITDANGKVIEVKGLGGRATTAAQARRELRVHQRHPSRDGGRNDAGNLPDDRGGRVALRRAGPVVHAVRAAHPAL